MRICVHGLGTVGLPAAPPLAADFEWTSASVEEAVEGADCPGVVTDHGAFRALDIDRIGDPMSASRVVDGVNLLDYDACRAGEFVVRVRCDGTGPVNERGRPTAEGGP